MLSGWDFLFLVVLLQGGPQKSKQLLNYQKIALNRIKTRE